MFKEQARRIALHALPIFIAQLVSMGMGIIDTILLGRFTTHDLAAAAIGIGVYIPTLLALMGILQAISPIVSHHKGAGNDAGITNTFQQSFWIALLLAIPGIFFLWHPDPLLNLFTIEPEIADKARLYLKMLSFGFPFALLYRLFYLFCNALGQPRPLVLISLFGTCLHGFLAWNLVTGQWFAPLGIQGCGISNAMVNFAMASGCYFYISKHPKLRPYRLFTSDAPKFLPAIWREFLKMGVPMGLSNFVEISAFTMTALFVAKLGAEITGAHRIVANLASVAYMLPLSISIATIAQVGHSLGARDFLRARASVICGMSIATMAISLLSGAFWLLREPIIFMFTEDEVVRNVALGLIGYVVIYQILDAMQAVAGFSLRGYKITFAPMFVHVLSFWGIGIIGGWYLAFSGVNKMGAAGFWLAAIFALILACALLGTMIYVRMRKDVPHIKK